MSSVELTTRILDRIQQHNGKLNAIVALAPDAVDRARAADEARARRDWWGPFHGVPCTIKDTFEVAGVTTTAGSPALRSHVPARDAAVVARLRAAGMIVLGKTNVPLFAADWQSYNAVYGQTNNPWDVTRTPGGSTGGGAAALAAGLTYLEPGSDLAGSIRIPAHFCGVYGHKPSLDVVPMRGHIPPPPGISASAALDAAGGRPARALRRRPARGARGAGRARRRRGAGVAVVLAARARHPARRLSHRLRPRRSARPGRAGGGRRARRRDRGAAPRPAPSSPRAGRRA